MYSIEGLDQNPVIDDENLKANPELQGKGYRFLDLFDLHIQMMSEANLMVIVNNHNSKSGWCCHFSQDEGLWYAAPYTEKQWLDSLTFFTKRYKDNPFVVAIDLRNEVHDFEDTHLTWGDGNEKTDWGLAAVKAGNAVLEVNPNVIIVVMAMCFGADLRPMKAKPTELIVPNRVVYQSHNYLEYNYFSQISKMLAPWREIRGWALVITIIILSTLVALYVLWRRLKRPLPALGVLLISVGSWIGFFALLAAWMSSSAFDFSTKFCKVGGESDIIPWLHGSMIVFAVSFGLVFVGMLFILRSSFFSRRVSERNSISKDNSGSFSPLHTDGSPPSFFPADAPPHERIPAEREIALTTTVSSQVSADTYGAKLTPPGNIPSNGSGGQDGAKTACCHSSPDASPYSTTDAGSTVPLATKGRPEGANSSMRTETGLEGVTMPRQSRILGCCVPGFSSCRRAVRTEAGWMDRELSDSSTFDGLKPPEWDVGLCCGLQLFLVMLCLLIIFVALFVFANIFSTYAWMEYHLDGLWGFALDHGTPYTAPVWMGEFGHNVRGSYWLNFVRYLSKRDVDFAYWAINGKKYGEGQIDGNTGNFILYDEPKWENESFGLLMDDYQTVRHPWKLLDLKGLMESPARFFSDSYPCSRNAYGAACGEGSETADR
jgi:hypothetical protein